MAETGGLEEKTAPPPPSPPPPTPTPPPPEAFRPGHPSTYPQRCPSQRPRLLRRPHWRSSPQVHAPALPAAGTVPTSPAHMPPSSPHLPHRLHTPPHTSTAPPHRAYPTRRRHQTRASPTRPPPYPLAPIRNRLHLTRSPHRAAPPHAVPRGTRRSIHSDRPCPPTTSPSPQGASPI